MADPGASLGDTAVGGVEIDVLGGFRVRVDGREVGEDRWPGARAAQLVQLLALAEGHRLARDLVVDTLWPRLDAQAGAANLRKAAHHARQALGCADAVVLRGGQVVLFPRREVSVDAARFERLAALALRTGDPAACAEAAQAHPGELLPGARYDAWAEPARERLRGLLLQLLRAAGLWERLAELEPTDEPAHRELMRAALEGGNRPAAIRWYGRLRGALHSALGVRPDRSTEALYARCVAGLLPAPPVFVGRAVELAQAAAWLDAAAAARSGALAVEGTAGIGKSAFSGQLCAVAAERGWAVQSVIATREARPYAVTAALVERMLLDDRALLDAVGDAARAVLAMLSPLASPARPLQGPLARHQVVGALRRLLVAAAQARPTLLHVDDAHLVDEADADVLLHLAVTGRPVAVALALRPQAGPAGLERGLARLARTGLLARIELGPMPDEDATALVLRASSAPHDSGLVDRIVRRAAGNPFAALELASCAAPGPATQLPVSVRDAVAARLCDVDTGTMSLLERLALAGDAFDTSLALAMSPEGDDAAYAHLDRALRAGVLVVVDGGYRFRHELVRQALVERVPPHRRLKAHREAAARLAALGAPAAAIAGHLLAGGSLDEAASWLLTAARDATRLAAFADTVRHLAPLLARDPAHPEALRLRAEALDALGDPAAVAAYGAAAEAAAGTDADDLRAKAALARVKMGDPRGGLQALEGLRPASVEGRLAEALAYAGAAALGVADPAMGTAKAAEARRLALLSGDTAAIVVASWAQAAAAHARGELHGSVWADLHDTCQLPHLAVRVFDGHLCITQRFLYGARPYPQVIAFADELAAEARRLGAARGHAFGVTLRGEAELLSGRLDAAEDDLRLGGRLHRAIGGATGEALSLQRRAELAMHRGRRADASDLLDEALDLARQTDIGFHLFDRIYGARIALCDDPQQALAALEDAEDAVRGPLETCPGCRITFAVPAAIAAARAGRIESAERHAESVRYLAEVVMRLPAWHAAHHEVRAHLAQAAGDRRAAAEHFAAAARGFAGAGQPLDAARCSERAGGSR